MSQSRAYYNEIEPFAADWIRNLIARGLIAPGDVDTRSIIDVRPDDLRGYTQCHFFAGIGGWSYALRSAGWDDARPVWTGSCPCQPFSLAGKQKGFDDARHLWPVWRELIRECDPAVVFGEQVASATDWLSLVRSDLEAMGRAVGAMPIQAASAGADHLRDRYWFVADNGAGRRAGPLGRQSEQSRGTEAVGAGNPDHMGFTSSERRTRIGAEPEYCEPGQASQSDWPDEHRDLADAVRGRTGDASGCGNRTEAETVGINGNAPRAGSAVGINGADSHDVADSKSIADARERLRAEPRRINHSDAERGDGSCELSWVTGADGKARRVKSGVRLLADGVPNRVGTLRGFGNAIDYRPATAFIEAADFAMNPSPALPASPGSRP